MEILSLPAVYDTAFQFRDASATGDFIEECIRMYTDIPVRSVVDIACGTGHYTREIARRGYRLYGIDNNAATCRYARAKAEAESLKLHIICHDMVDFTLPDPCDLALNFFDSLTYVLDFRSLIRHLQTVSAHLSPGGLYIVEVGVIDHFDNHNVEEVWTETRGDLAVTSTYYREGTINPENRTFIEHCSFRATCRQHCACFTLKLVKAALYFDELTWLVKQSGTFSPLVYYEDFDPGAFLSKDELPWRVIAVLQKTG
ncbi:methyltransferase domain-containing protein [candidate division KSB3 bacterium]|uniref:Methyltransferase domain-containing protein n=1 Tax=candidate division KSB3 bacterium TaxID=2044937 RepID=A0A9D5K029_9BACT|nr:methyltransferase domain-containing protein [candidate division KSB3 bacterium]MBD3327424.1 methyltransferase domain-containing protein [candidate division KSB3 bacterium]